MPKAVDYWTWNEMSYAKWRNAANQRLESVYLISLVDAGIDEDYLKGRWEEKQTPYEFVEWLANKHDLDPKSAVGL